MSELTLTRDQYLEFEKLGLGVFQPVRGFMNEDTFRHVVTEMRLLSGEPFPLPIYLDVSEEDAARLKSSPEVSLIYQDVEVGQLSPESFFRCDREAAAQSIFGTRDPAHPGVAMFVGAREVFVGGGVKLKNRVQLDISSYELTPEQTRAEFERLNWKTIVGFQTRNVPHRAHEYLQRVALEFVDGLLIQPLLGRKKVGDYSPEAIIEGYKALINKFYPANRVMLTILSTAMRYAGPREAVFHAIVRRNYGCTHFIIGRDHAGVGNYYGKYDAHELSRRFDGELGIEIMRLHGPYYCAACDGIVTEHTCPHEITNPDAINHIAGTDMRAMLSGGMNPDPRLMRDEVLQAIKSLDLFISECEE